MIYEALTADGEPITLGQRQRNDGPRPRRIRQSRAHLFLGVVRRCVGQGAYFGLDGQSKRRVFLGSPVAFSRITSTFAMHVHPILNTWRAPRRRLRRAHGHWCAASATARSRWPAGRTAAGNVVQIKHSNDRANLRPPEPDRRSQRPARRAGCPGRCCRSHGLGHQPRTHFEFKVRASRTHWPRPRRPEAMTIPAGAKAQFAAHVAQTRGSSRSPPRWPAAAATASEFGASADAAGAPARWRLRSPDADADCTSA